MHPPRNIERMEELVELKQIKVELSSSGSNEGMVDNGWTVVETPKPLVETAEVREDCSGPESHVPPRRHRGKRTYVLFRAAEDGCLKCVRKLLEEEKVDISAVSETKGYSALDFAEWGVKKGSSSEGDAVVKFLRKAQEST